MHEVIIQSLSKGDLSVHTLCFGFVTANKHETTTCKRLLGSTFFLHLHKSDVFRLDFGVAFMSLTTIFYLNFSTIQVSFINSCMAVLLSDITTLFWPCQSFILKGDIMSVSTQVQRWLFQPFIYPGKIFVKSGGLWSTGQAPWCDCVYMNGWTWTQVHRIFECNKNSSRWWEFEPVNSWCEAHFILWPLKPPPSLCPESRTSSSVLHEQFPLTFPNIHVEYMTHSSALTMKCP